MHQLWLDNSLHQVAPALSSAIFCANDTDFVDTVLHQLLLVPIKILTPESRDLLSVEFLDSPPEEFYPIQVRSVRSVLDNLDIVLRWGILARRDMDTGIVPKNGDLFTFSHSASEALKEMFDVSDFKCTPNFEHLGG